MSCSNNIDSTTSPQRGVGTSERAPIDEPLPPLPLGESPPLTDPRSEGSESENPLSDGQDEAAVDENPGDLADGTIPDFFAGKRRIIGDIPALEEMAKRKDLAWLQAEWVVPWAVKCLPCGAVVAEAGDALRCVLEEVPPAYSDSLFEGSDSPDGPEPPQNPKPFLDLWALCPCCGLPFRARWPQGPDGRLSLKEAHFPPPLGNQGIELRLSAEVNQSWPSNSVLSLTGGEVRARAVQSVDMTEGDPRPDMNFSVDLSRDPRLRKIIDEGRSILNLKITFSYGALPVALPENVRRNKEAERGWVIPGMRFSLDPGQFPGVLRKPASE